MDERRIERLLREGPPFATAYVARPLPIDDAVASHQGRAGRRLALAFLTVVLMLVAALVALLAIGFLRATHPAPLVIARGAVISLHPTDGSPERNILLNMPDRHGGWCEDSMLGVAGSCGLFHRLTMTADGRRLVLSVFRLQAAGDASDSIDLFVLNVDGTGLRLVHHEPTGKFDFALAPDGHHLAYAAGPPEEEGRRMAILDLDTGDEIALPPGGGPMMWSPDGGHIAFQVEKEPASAPETWIMDAAGKESRFLGNYRPLAWTADSESLFVTRSSGQRALPPELVAIDDPSQPTRTWPLGATDSIVPSPDGRRVAMVQTTDQAGRLRIVLADRDGSDPVAMPPFRADRATVCWSPDGRWLLWLVGHSDGSQTSIDAYDTVDASTRTLVRVHTRGERAIYAPGCV
jgi:Tol biopolymer transport system component